MRKFKSILLILLGGLLALFLYENWIPAPHLKMFGKEIIPTNMSVLILACFTLGGMVGFLGYLALSRSRKKSPSPDSGEQKAPEPQNADQPQEPGQ